MVLGVPQEKKQRGKTPNWSGTTFKRKEKKGPAESNIILEILQKKGTRLLPS